MWINGLLGWYGNLLCNGTKALGTNLAVEAGLGKVVNGSLAFAFAFAFAFLFFAFASLFSFF